ncbi:MAG: trypsin-like peptidase domain-containing protein [Hyphomonas sp.]|uniref:trypsin-like peptidase domain-containing protein n=1 Tax=Hyphomonas sp. TaxID=87 RepID=UPI00182D03BB|nr:trypsin-like peptidase domain-containing protein [Hyphomonas sp.]MBA3068126.1 trypsin-like peptidase domain-containing protein [Hyphomonas sp.]MBU3922027.1 serine protease [Alphaproteobacteria bacterium]MBU4061139.1 serine protease [Alphaproteobacteria bacterium]MBU4162863.1 serine protease [Alphaproteobacteria bacterium]
MSVITSPISLCTVRVEMLFNDTLLATGSSFFYDYKGRSFLVTNRHNVTGCDQNTGKPLDVTRGGIPNSIRFKVPVAEKSGNSFRIGSAHVLSHLKWEEDDRPWLEHPQLGASADVVAFDIAHHWPKFGKPVFHANTLPNYVPLSLKPALSVSVVGYPFGQAVNEFYPVWVSGSLASEPSFNADGKPALFIDCRTNRGSSGSPVFAYVAGGLAQTENDKLTSSEHGIFMQYTHTDGTHWGMFGAPAQRFIGIYSGRINDKADIGLVWRTEVIEAVCSTCDQ